MLETTLVLMDLEERNMISDPPEIPDCPMA